jgi:hypothetical protein
VKKRIRRVGGGRRENRLTDACVLFQRLFIMAGMSVDSDRLWDAFVDVMLAAGHVWEGRSRYGDKPALFAGSREIAHLEMDGTIDVRITRAGWARARQDFAADPAVLHDRGRRDWIELRPKRASDLDRLAPLLAITAAANA